MPTYDERFYLKLNLLVILTLLVLLLVAFVSITRMFLIPVLLALTFTTLFHPVYVWLLKKLGGRKNLAAILMVLLMLLCLLAPTYLLVNAVAQQAVNLYTGVRPVVNRIIAQGDDGLLGDLKRVPVLRRIDISSFDWEGELRKSAEGISAAITYVVRQTTGGLLSFVTGLFVMLYTMFFFFRDGDHILSRLRFYSPIRDEYEELLINRFAMISRATVKGTLIIGLMQGGLGGLCLLVFGVKTWLLWSMVMVILSVIPLVGPWLVMVPAGVFLIIMGDVWQGVVVIVFTMVIIGNADNLVRPRLVGHDARLHDLVIFFSTLGGLAVFGVMGFIVGPVVAAMFFSVLDIYGREFRNELDSSEEEETDQPAVDGATDAT